MNLVVLALTCDIFYLGFDLKKTVEKTPTLTSLVASVWATQTLPSSAPQPLLREGNGRLAQAKPNDNETYQSLT